jgi:hypothetical protein
MKVVGDDEHRQRFVAIQPPLKAWQFTCQVRATLEAVNKDVGTATEILLGCGAR